MYRVGILNWSAYWEFSRNFFFTKNTYFTPYWHFKLLKILLSKKDGNFYNMSYKKVTNIRKDRNKALTGEAQN